MPRQEWREPAQQPCPPAPRAHPDLEHGAHGLVVAELQGHVAAVAQLRDVPPFPEDPVAPRGNTTFLAKTE